MHASTIQRRGRNKLLKIKDADGNRLEGQNDAMNGISNFYIDLYTAETPSCIDQCLRVIPNCISESMNASLTSPILFKEVECVVFDLGAYKAPGPDGLNGLFFQKNWETIKNDVFNSACKFFTDGVLARG